MRKAGLLFLLVLLKLQLPAQYSIRVKVDSMPTRKAYLFEYVGMKNNMLDSAKVAPDGSFSFTLAATAHPGLYRIVVGPEQFWDFIFNREQIRMQTHFNAIIDSLKVPESTENQLLNRYMQFFIGMNRKADALQKLAGLYPDGDPFRDQVVKELQKVRSSDPEKVTREIMDTYPHSYAARFLKMELNPRVPTGVPAQNEMIYVLDHFWDDIDFHDTSMMYSPGLPNRIRLYFSLFQQAVPSKELEEAMKKGLDHVMSAAAVNDILFEFILQDIADWAERTEYDDFFSYLTEFYLAKASCTDEKRKGEFSDIVASYQKTAPGKVVPEIVIPRDRDGALILSEIPSKYTLIIFWASWCPHCSEMLPQVKALYDRYKRSDLEILAISLDDKKEDWQKAIRENGYNWINHSELKGWDCSIAYDYGIRATPTFILVDKSRTVIGKPRNAALLEQKLNELGVRLIK
jgi:thiol-disulfide isomerase/thioredoxin